LLDCRRNQVSPTQKRWIVYFRTFILNSKDGQAQGRLVFGRVEVLLGEPASVHRGTSTTIATPEQFTTPYVRLPLDIGELFGDPTFAETKYINTTNMPCNALRIHPLVDPALYTSIITEEHLFDFKTCLW
jgi:hypothetical protein